MASSNFLKTAAICGIAAAATFIPVGVSAADATTAKVANKVALRVISKRSGTFLGSAAMTQYGAVQVSITVKKGKITKVTSPVYPVGSFRDQQINAQAIPLLEHEVLKAQSSNINNISGASYTAQGFYTSLVSALGKAGLK